MERKYIKKFDVFLIAVLLTISLIFIFWQSESNEPVIAEIFIENIAVKRIDLSRAKDEIITISDVKFEIKDKKIRFVTPDCPDKICEKTGFIDKVGQTAACLPKKVFVKIKSKDKNDYDIIAE